MPISLHEARLRDAMLQGSADELDTLLSDDLIFTNHEGKRLSKADDLAAHASGLLKISRIDARKPAKYRVLGDAIVACVEVDLVGSFAGQAFAGAYAYTRLWHRQGGDWQVAVAHCSVVA